MSDSSLSIDVVVHQVEIVVKRHLGQPLCFLGSDLPVSLPQLVFDNLVTDLQDQPNLLRRYEETYFRQHYCCLPL